MIAHLQGTLLEGPASDRGRSAGCIIVDCQGVGYEVTLSSASLTRLPSEGAPVMLRIYTHALESRLTLYGFVTREERELFDKLITVKKVGPATAIEILSGAASPEDLAQLIARGEVSGLQRVKGVGKKTAELLVVELKDKCELMLASWHVRGVNVPPPQVASAPRARSPILQDVASALINLSFKSSQVDQVLQHMTVPDGATLEGLIRDALRELKDLPR